jgi:anti-sigma B factor antagonist
LHKDSDSIFSFKVAQEEIDSSSMLIEAFGEVDLYAAPDFQEELTRAIDSGKQHLVVDLSAVTFVDSTTLGVLLSSHKRLGPTDGVLLVCPHGDVRRIFEITGLDRVFAMYEYRDDALAALRAPR